MTEPAVPTSDRLAAALREIRGIPPAMIQRAVDGYYDDYKSPLAFPQVRLFDDLRQLAGLPTTGDTSKAAIFGLISRLMDGEFDGTKEEAVAWSRTPEGRETFRKLVGGE